MSKKGGGIGEIGGERERGGERGCECEYRMREGGERGREGSTYIRCMYVHSEEVIKKLWREQFMEKYM